MESQGNYYPGEMVRLTAVPAPNYEFVSWSGGKTGADNPLVFNAGADLSIVANFERPVWEQLRKMTAGDGAADDFFGTAVSSVGDRILVGAHKNDDMGNESGSAYILDASTGAELLKLLPADGTAADQFGKAVALSNEVAVVGSYKDEAGRGTVYVFDATSGQQLQKLVANDGAAGDYFGYAVAIHGDYIVVGSYGDDDVGSGSGSAYVFRASNGQQLFKLTAADGAEGDGFGKVVGIHGDTIVIGAPDDDDRGDNSGSAYLFKVSSKQQVAKLLANDGLAGDLFGGAVAVSQNHILVGARLQNGGRGAGSGAADLFDSADGSYTARLKASDGSTSDNFGGSVAVYGDYALIGACWDGDKGASSGSAYVFNLNTRSQLTKLLASDGTTSDYFGYAVGVSAEYAVVSATLDDDKGSSSGSVYVFDMGTASTEPLPDQVAVTATGENGSAVGIGSYGVGQTAIVTAVPDPGYYFTGWSGSIITMDNPIQFTVSEAADLTMNFSSVDAVVALDFNDQAWNTKATASTLFANSGNFAEKTYAFAGAMPADVLFNYNTTGGTALQFSQAAPDALHIQGPRMHWRDSFVLQARVQRGEGEGAIDLVLDEVGTTTLRWLVEADGKVSLTLANGDLVATTATPVVTVGEWVNLQAVVDLSKTGIENVVTLYKDGVAQALDPASTLGGSLIEENASVPVSGVATKLLQRSDNIAISVDFIRMMTDVSAPTYDPANFYAGEVDPNIDPNASASILLNPSRVFKRVVNHPDDFSDNGTLKAGKTVVYDTHPNPVQVFHGLFEIEYALETADFNGELIVDILVKKPEDAVFKKIGEMSPTANPGQGNGTWVQKFYWNSRKAAYDWTEGDAQPYRTTENVQLKFKVR
jgi:hypothetical protein